MDSLRISDADRESAVALLGEQYALGRLTRDELDERSDAVWSAKTEGDLAPIFDDLPVRRSGPPRGASSAPRRSRRWPVPLAPVVVALVILTVVTHVPFVLLLLLGFLWFGRQHSAWGCRR